MIRQVDLRGKVLSKSEYAALLPRAAMDVASALKLVEPILARVKSGDESELIKLATEFDGVTPKKIRVPKDVIEKALAALDPALPYPKVLVVALMQNQVRPLPPTYVTRNLHIHDFAKPFHLALVNLAANLSNPLFYQS